MSNTAPRLSNQLFQEDWNTSPAKQSATEAKISYLMVEQVTPPEYLWERIAHQLDKQETQSNIQLVPEKSPAKTITAMVAGAGLAVAAILYLLV